MLDTIRSRLIAIAILVALSVWALWPRQVTTRVRGEKGLDLQGGIHLALELDESRGQVPNRADAIDRALKVIRIRIDQFGVAEPLVQKEGAGRIVVELPGISDPGRAKEIVQRSAFLEFQMTDKENLFRQALPGMDRALAAAGVSEASVGRQMADSAARAPEVPSSAVEDILSGARPPAADTGKAAARHDTARARRDTARDTAALLGGPLSPLLFAGSMAGQYLVAEEKVPIVQAMVERAEVQRLLPRGIVLRWGGEPLSRGARAFRPVYALQERPIITGEYLIDAKARIDPLMNQAIVVFQL